MQFKNYFFGLSTEDRKDFATKVGTSVGHLTNHSYGYVPLAPALCVAIEQTTRKAVTRQELRPDWRLIWPELIQGRAARQSATGIR